MNLYEAIRSRQSVRSYRNTPIAQEQLRRLQSYTGRVVPLMEDIKTEFVFYNMEEKKSRPRGLFLVHSPHVLALYSEEKEGWAFNAGYMMEQMALYMAAKGIGSCYMGGAKVLAKEGMRQAIVLAFGYGKKGIYRDQEEAKRLDLMKLCVFPEGKDISPDISVILQAARLAPSSFNSQPWRFVVYKDRIHVFACSSRLNIPAADHFTGLNMGIVLSHMMLAAEEQWVSAQIIREDGLVEKEYRKGRYICTVTLS